jgi:hypothetical protein
MSLVAWLDYSEVERRRMLDVIDLFRDKGTVDELGLGTIRDAFADLLFPGTSTVMSRARYYLLIPWIYRELESRQVPGSEFAARAKDTELRLIPVIAASDDNRGNIGRRAGFGLKRLPSGIYWAGLRIWGIRNGRTSQAEYHRSIDQHYRRTQFQRARNETRDSEHDDIEKGYWHDKLPPRPSTFPKQCTLKLRQVDAEYLSQRIRTAPGTRDSLLAELMHRQTPWDDQRLIWFHPDAGSWPTRLREIVDHARLFSEVMHGATLLYNYILMGLLDKCSEFESKLDEWADLMETRSAAFEAWDKRRFWEIAREENPRLGPRAMNFAEAWWELVASRGARAISKDQAAHRLVKEREAHLKGKLSRLNNESARKRWQEPSGSGQLDYRWGITQVILNDIFDGLAQVADEEGDEIAPS